MNNNIKFEIAQLLKEKEYDKPCYNAYDTHGMQFANGWLDYLWENGNEIPFTKKDLKPQDTLAPTIAEVVMWLYEKYGIWIAVTQELGYNITFCYQIMGEHISATNKPYFETPTEAYSEAILYTLKNLI